VFTFSLLKAQNKAIQNHHAHKCNPSLYLFIVFVLKTVLSVVLCNCSVLPCRNETWHFKQI